MRIFANAPKARAGKNRKVKSRRQVDSAPVLKCKGRVRAATPPDPVAADRGRDKGKAKPEGRDLAEAATPPDPAAADKGKGKGKDKGKPEDRDMVEVVTPPDPAAADRGKGRAKGKPAVRAMAEGKEVIPQALPVDRDNRDKDKPEVRDTAEGKEVIPQALPVDRDNRDKGKPGVRAMAAGKEIPAVLPVDRDKADRDKGKVAGVTLDRPVDRDKEGEEEATLDRQAREDKVVRAVLATASWTIAPRASRTSSSPPWSRRPPIRFPGSSRSWYMLARPTPI